ncbi:HNH endonuclease [Stutzerimonas stutzeri]|jgi:hypothetical protein|uniref:HNH endonuclease n=2 Tax=Stutzerimonas stutzeri TaxID=316 RepID=UPI000AD14BA5|nr:HNH endonuclease [Pseudomonas sp.]TFZ20095.1 hypothetical protein AK6_12580 [Stutzerimonas stutzeri]
MANPYADRQWAAFREKVVNLDGAMCVECGRTRSDGVVLQVHHRQYIRGRKPWEYDYADCETLCKGCHAREHGEIRPSSGWVYAGEDDLGDLTGTCELCSSAIRYVHHIQHPHWEPMGVGTVCCDNLTGTQEAAEARRRLGRLRRFLASPNWTTEGTRLAIVHKGFKATLLAEQGAIRLVINDLSGQQLHPSVAAAQEFLFDFIDSGQASAFFSERKARRGTTPLTRTL